LLAAYHFDRLFSGLKLLHITPVFTSDDLLAAVAPLCKQNDCTGLARVRIAVYRDDTNNASYLIEATGLAAGKLQWNERGWRVLLYPFARKSCDAFANLKSANYLPYVMAGQYATAHSVDECLVLNAYNRICDGSKTNLFYVKKDAVFTPALSEGCVAGVMRRAVIEHLKKLGYSVHQQTVSEEDVLLADAVFLTNAIEGVRWVQYVGEREYEYGDLKKWHAELFASLLTH
jgi:branched-chain amino acid aminotransferase